MLIFYILTVPRGTCVISFCVILWMRKMPWFFLFADARTLDRTKTTRVRRQLSVTKRRQLFSAAWLAHFSTWNRKRWVLLSWTLTLPEKNFIMSKEQKAYNLSGRRYMERQFQSCSEYSCFWVWPQIIFLKKKYKIARENAGLWHSH